MSNFNFDENLKASRPFSHTIAAIATPLASSGLGVIRISGGEAIKIASRVFKPVSKSRTLENAKGYSALFGGVYENLDGNEPVMLDECVALVFHAPNSYTGEDVVELSCHGGVYLLQQILRIVYSAGARPAEAGEFTRRAFVNGKIDLTGAEAVIDLISAGGRLAAKTALAAKEGSIFKKIEAVKEDLLGAVANFTAFVDYPDDDIPELSNENLREILENAKNQLEKLVFTFDSGRILREGVNTVIVGKPNVGKSTLMNLISGSNRSIVTDIPGTTRDVVEESVRVGGIVLNLSDTAGVRDTSDEVEKIGVRLALDKLETAALVLTVFDASQPLDENDKSLIERLLIEQETDLIENGIAIINKSDLSGNIDYEYIKSKYKHIVYMSAKTGEGYSELEAAISEIVGINKLDISEPILATERQRLCVKNAIECVGEAVFALNSGLTLDAVNVSVDGAIAALLELTGESVSEAVVNEVFKRFCVGK